MKQTRLLKQTLLYYLGNRMIAISRLLFFISFLVLFSCENKKIEYKYFQDGKIESKTEFRNGKRDGIALEYYRDGTIKYKEEWENGELNGDFVEFYPNGKVKKKGIIKNNIVLEITHFYESGKVSSYQYFDEDGYISSAQNYKENGERDSLVFPYIQIHDVKIGTIAKLKCKIVNLNVLKRDDSLFDKSKLFITSGFDTTKYGEILKDTLAIIRSNNAFEFEYEFKPAAIGENYICGQLILKKDEGETTSVQVHNFRTWFNVYK